MEGQVDAASQILITGLLKAWRGGDAAAFDRLTALLYVELKKIARGYTRSERPDATIQATALVNEAYLKLAGTAVDWQDRAHFFAVSAQVMRRILVDGARARTRGKRGGGVIKVQLDETPDIGGMRSRELIAVDGALEQLAAFDARKAQVVELRFFGGLTVKETAEVLKVSEETVLRDWRLARSWLMRELAPSK
jgi:RNA polymerase sigma factor (TIGR02999 family)